MTSNSTDFIDGSASIAPTAVIGSPYRPLLDGREIQVRRPTEINKGVWIGQFVTIGQGVRIGAASLIEDYAQIQARAEIGERVLVTGRSWIGMDARVGSDSVIKGHIGDSARIGKNCRVAGDLIHRQLDPSRGWDDQGSEEPAPFVDDEAFIGWKAVIVGGVHIGRGAYVCAGALVTRDVPPGWIAAGKNRFMPPSRWRGRLAKSPFFSEAALLRAGELG
ncbi:MAG TPA: DapH/DapD/GlmU-related protein [Streptosporangiaceae bacterium]|nr:DapH/DapD/GlmU-related protein [Streptosporangiaceae bacterium]